MEAFLALAADGAFWVSVGQIILIDILLGGDNAIVIALACRKLPQAQRRRGILWGVAGAIVLRIVLIFFAVKLLTVPWLKLIGAALLIWIGIKLLLPEDEDEHGKITASDSIIGAIKTIIIADAVMSVDNVIAVAAAAHGDMGLVVFGILVSVPIIVWGSKLVLMLMDRFPVVIVLGGGLLGWIAGEMAYADNAVTQWTVQWPAHLKYASALAGAGFVMLVGLVLGRRKQRARAIEIAHAASGAMGRGGKDKERA